MVVVAVVAFVCGRVSELRVSCPSAVGHTNTPVFSYQEAIRLYETEKAYQELAYANDVLAWLSYETSVCSSLGGGQPRGKSQELVAISPQSHCVVGHLYSPQMAHHKGEGRRTGSAGIMALICLLRTIERT